MMTPAETSAYVDAAAVALRLSIDPAHRPGVIRYVALAAEMAALLESPPLLLTDDPAEAFVPIAPKGRAA